MLQIAIKLEVRWFGLALRSRLIFWENRREIGLSPQGRAAFLFIGDLILLCFEPYSLKSLQQFSVRLHKILASKKSDFIARGALFEPKPDQWIKSLLFLGEIADHQLLVTVCKQLPLVNKLGCADKVESSLEFDLIARVTYYEELLRVRSITHALNKIFLLNYQVAKREILQSCGRGYFYLARKFKKQILILRREMEYRR